MLSPGPGRIIVSMTPATRSCGTRCAATEAAPPAAEAVTCAAPSAGPNPAGLFGAAIEKRQIKALRNTNSGTRTGWRVGPKRSFRIALCPQPRYAAAPGQPFIDFSFTSKPSYVLSFYPWALSADLPIIVSNSLHLEGDAGFFAHSVD